MPHLPLRPCRQPGCRELTRDGYCPPHKRAKRQVVERERGSSAARGYGSRWRKARATYLKSHPLCECQDCTRAERLIPATVVDHITPHRGDPALFWDTANWQAMSKSCHDRKTAREDGRWGNRPPG